MIETSEAAGSCRSYVVLGASNVSLAWKHIVNLLTPEDQTPTRIITAFGMGRAYVSESSGFAAYRLPGILHCGLWSELNRLECSESPQVLLTDFGNDILYGRDPQEIADAALTCIARVRNWHHDADIVLTLPPIDSVNSLSPSRFRFFRQVLFPGCRLTLQEVVSAAEQLHKSLEAVARDHRVKLYQPDLSLFGLDPIHIKRRQRRQTFSEMMSLWENAPSLGRVTQRHRKPKPFAWQSCGRNLSRQQPFHLKNGLEVYAY